MSNLAAFVLEGSDNFLVRFECGERFRTMEALLDKERNQLKADLV